MLTLFTATFAAELAVLGVAIAVFVASLQMTSSHYSPLIARRLLLRWPLLASGATLIMAPLVSAALIYGSVRRLSDVSAASRLEDLVYLALLVASLASLVGLTISSTRAVDGTKVVPTVIKAVSKRRLCRSLDSQDDSDPLDPVFEVAQKSVTSGPSRRVLLGLVRGLVATLPKWLGWLPVTQGLFGMDSKRADLIERILLDHTWLLVESLDASGYTSLTSDVVADLASMVEDLDDRELGVFVTFQRRVAARFVEWSSYRDASRIMEPLGQAALRSMASGWQSPFDDATSALADVAQAVVGHSSWRGSGDRIVQTDHGLFVERNEMLDAYHEATGSLLRRFEESGTGVNLTGWINRQYQVTHALTNRLADNAVRGERTDELIAENARSSTWTMASTTESAAQRGEGNYVLLGLFNLRDIWSEGRVSHLWQGPNGAEMVGFLVRIGMFSEASGNRDDRGRLVSERVVETLREMEAEALPTTQLDREIREFRITHQWFDRNVADAFEGRL